jgi:hypothetical protein
MSAILARKLGMTQLFREDGRVERVTVLEAGPCPVTGTISPPSVKSWVMPILRPRIAGITSPPACSEQRAASSGAP